MQWESEREYKSFDDALADLEAGLEKIIEGFGD